MQEACIKAENENNSLRRAAENLQKKNELLEKYKAEEESRKAFTFKQIVDSVQEKRKLQEDLESSRKQFKELQAEFDRTSSEGQRSSQQTVFATSLEKYTKIKDLTHKSSQHPQVLEKEAEKLVSEIMELVNEFQEVRNEVAKAQAQTCAENQSFGGKLTELDNKMRRDNLETISYVMDVCDMEALDQNLEDKNAHIIALDSGYKGAVDALERIRIYLVDQKGLDSCGNDKYRTPENDDMPFWSSSPESKEDKQVTREFVDFHANNQKKELIKQDLITFLKENVTHSDNEKGTLTSELHKEYLKKSTLFKGLHEQTKARLMTKISFGMHLSRLAVVEDVCPFCVDDCAKIPKPAKCGTLGACRVNFWKHLSIKKGTEEEEKEEKAKGFSQHS